MPIAPSDLAAGDESPTRCDAVLIQSHWPCSQTALRSWRWGVLGSFAVHSFLLFLLASITLVKEPPPLPALDTRAELHLVPGTYLAPVLVLELGLLEAPLPQDLAAQLPEMDTGSQDTTKTEKHDKMFPDGLVHNFGKVWSGTIATHAFRIVNTSAVPLRIMSLRTS